MKYSHLKSPKFSLQSNFSFVDLNLFASPELHQKPKKAGSGFLVWVQVMSSGPAMGSVLSRVC